MFLENKLVKPKRIKVSHQSLQMKKSILENNTKLKYSNKLRKKNTNHSSHKSKSKIQNSNNLTWKMFKCKICHKSKSLKVMILTLMISL
jgi:hypothetical protein